MTRTPSPGQTEVVVRAPGRVNLIGDHTDYTGGLALPMAIDREVVVRGGASPEPLIDLSSDQDPSPARFPLPVTSVDEVEPLWARRVAAIARNISSPVWLCGAIVDGTAR